MSTRAKSIFAKTELNVETNERKILDFVKNVGVKDVEFNPNYNSIIITYYDSYGSEIKEYWNNKSEYKFKTEEGKVKAISYQFSAFANICKIVNPNLKLIDTVEMEEIADSYIEQIKDHLPSPTTGFLKLVFNKTDGQYYKFKVSPEFPAYSLDEKNLEFKKTDLEKIIFKQDVVQPDSEVEETSEPEEISKKNSEDLPF